MTKLIRLIQPTMESVLAYQPKSLLLIFSTTKSGLFAMLYSLFFDFKNQMLQYAIRGYEYNYWVLHRNLLEFIYKILLFNFICN